MESTKSVGEYWNRAIKQRISWSENILERCILFVPDHRAILAGKHCNLQAEKQFVLSWYALPSMLWYNKGSNISTIWNMWISPTLEITIFNPPASMQHHDCIISMVHVWQHGPKMWVWDKCTDAFWPQAFWHLKNVLLMRHWTLPQFVTYKMYCSERKIFDSCGSLLQIHVSFLKLMCLNLVLPPKTGCLRGCKVYGTLQIGQKLVWIYLWLFSHCYR